MLRLLLLPLPYLLVLLLWFPLPLLLPECYYVQVPLENAAENSVAGYADNVYFGVESALDVKIFIERCLDLAAWALSDISAGRCSSEQELFSGTAHASEQRWFSGTAQVIYIFIKLTASLFFL